MPLRFTLRGLAAGGAAALAALALASCGSDPSVSAAGPGADETTTTTTTAPPETTVPETAAPDSSVSQEVVPPDAGATSTLPCDEAALANATASKYGSAEGFLVTDCVGDWAAGSTRHEFDAPVEILFHAENAAWRALDRGFGMCDRQGVPDDVARQLGCSL